MACNKTSYPSEKAARGSRGMSKLSARLRIYYCQDCRAFHMTKSAYGRGSIKSVYPSRKHTRRKEGLLE